MAAQDLSGLIAIGSLVVAALGVGVSPYTARKSYEWSRNADDERSRRAEVARRVQRGEDAANEILTLADEAAMLMTGWTGKAPGQEEFKGFHHAVRQKAELLTDDAVRSRMFDVANSLYYFGQAQEASYGQLSRWSIARAYQSAAHDVLRAYLHGRPCPDTPRLARLTDLIAKGGDLIAEQVDEEEADPLDEPGPPAAHET